jgi:hypothetical protein
MAKYEITHTCGHEVEHNIAGKIDDRPRKAQWLREQPCRDCQQQDKIAVAREQTARVEQSRELPELSGSEKQVRWAQDIRAAWLVQVEEFYTEGTRRAKAAGKEDTNGLLRNLVDSVVAQATTETAAKFWIDHRNDIAPTAGLKWCEWAEVAKKEVGK